MKIWMNQWSISGSTAPSQSKSPGVASAASCRNCSATSVWENRAIHPVSKWWWCFFSGNLLRVFSVMNKETSGGHMKKKLHWYPLVIGDEALFLWWYWSDRSNWRGVLWIFDDYTESFIFFEYCKRCFLVKHACIWVWKIRYLIPSTVN